MITIENTMMVMNPCVPHLRSIPLDFELHQSLGRRNPVPPFTLLIISRATGFVLLRIASRTDPNPRLWR